MEVKIANAHSRYEIGYPDLGCFDSVETLKLNDNQLFMGIGTEMATRYVDD